MKLIDLVLDVHRRLDSAGIEHALGGALALGYYADPRGTLDGDLLVFVPVAGADAVVDVLRPTGFAPRTPPADSLPISGVRLLREGERVHIDLFFVVDERYGEIAARRRTVPFGPDHEPMPILAPEDIVLFKLSFGRAKDWGDVEDLLATTPDVDLDVVEDLLVHLRGPSMYPPVARLRALQRAIRGAG